MAARSGRTRTLSISVDAATEQVLKEQAREHFGGNVSQLIAAMAQEAHRRAAVDRLAVWSGYSKLSRAERDAIEAGIQGELSSQKPKRRRAAA